MCTVTEFCWPHICWLCLAIHYFSRWRFLDISNPKFPTPFLHSPNAIDTSNCFVDRTAPIWFMFLLFSLAFVLPFFLLLSLVLWFSFSVLSPSIWIHSNVCILKWRVALLAILIYFAYVYYFAQCTLYRNVFLYLFWPNYSLSRDLIIHRIWFGDLYRLRHALWCDEHFTAVTVHI